MILVRGKDYYDYELVEGEGGEPDRLAIQFTPVFLKRMKATPNLSLEPSESLHTLPCRSSESSQMGQERLPGEQESGKPPPVRRCRR